MPQPLARVRSNASIIMCNAGDRPLRHNPALGLLAMEAIVSWSNVEQFMLHLYLDLMGGPKNLAAVSYMALEGSGPKEAALRAVASATLPEDHVRLLLALLKRSKSAERTRNKLAHWVWGYSPEIPDGFLLADPRLLIEEVSEDNVFVFTANDFKSSIAENDLLCGLGLRFRFVLKGSPANADNALYREICRELAIPET